MTWENMLQLDRPQMTIWRIRMACWITKAADTHSEYVIFIFQVTSSRYVSNRVCLLSDKLTYTDLLFVTGLLHFTIFEN
jgi:hypothetical protein